MSSRILTVAAVAAVGVASLASGTAAASAGALVSSPGSHVWRTAIEVPGAAALNQGGQAEIASVSCGSAGNCGAGGSYTDNSGHSQAFVVSEVNGIWHKAIEVPGTAALNRGGDAEVASVSCGSAGNCSAGGYYQSESTGGPFEAFVVSEVNGTWHKAIEVPGTAALNRGGDAEVASVSCASAGNCSAGGFYRGTGGATEAFVVSDVNGTWHKATELHITGALSDGSAETTSVSCALAGSCSAGGSYQGTGGATEAFVVSEANGTWHKAIEVPGTAALNTAGTAETTSVSCGSAGNCGAGGSFAGPVFHQRHVFVVSQADGTWETAIRVPGTGILNRGEDAAIASVSCGSAGNCGAGGYYSPEGSPFHLQAFVVSQANGTWHKAIEVPGTAALNQGGIAAVNSVSCASAVSCDAGGYYAGSSARQAFVVSEANGTWHKAIEVPGTAAINRGGDAEITSVSCASAGSCSAGGYYEDSSGHIQAFVVSKT